MALTKAGARRPHHRKGLKQTSEGNPSGVGRSSRGNRPRCAFAAAHKRNAGSDGFSQQWHPLPLRWATLWSQRDGRRKPLPSAGACWHPRPVPRGRRGQSDAAGLIEGDRLLAAARFLPAECSVKARLRAGSRTPEVMKLMVCFILALRSARGLEIGSPLRRQWADGGGTRNADQQPALARQQRDCGRAMAICSSVVASAQRSHFGFALLVGLLCRRWLFGVGLDLFLFLLVAGDFLLVLSAVSPLVSVIESSARFLLCSWPGSSSTGWRPRSLDWPRSCRAARRSASDRPCSRRWHRPEMMAVIRPQR